MRKALIFKSNPRKRAIFGPNGYCWIEELSDRQGTREVSPWDRASEILTRSEALTLATSENPFQRMAN